jgi:hypothetical protein
MEVNSFVHDVRFMSFSVHDSTKKESARKVLGWCHKSDIPQLLLLIVVYTYLLHFNISRDSWGLQEVEPGNVVVVVQGFNLPMIVRK